jgi:hypothetical protein
MIYAGLLWSGEATTIEVLEGGMTPSRYNDENPPDQHRWNCKVRLVAFENTEGKAKDHYVIGKEGYEKTIYTGDVFTLTMKKTLKDNAILQFKEGGVFRVFNKSGWHVIPVDEKTVSDEVKATNYANVKNGTTPISQSPPPNNPVVKDDAFWRRQAEGKVRHGFAVESYKMGYDIKDKKVQARIEGYTDYVMTQRDPKPMTEELPSQPDVGKLEPEQPSTEEWLV